MTTTQSQRSPRMSDEQMAEMRDLVGSTSFKSIALSWTVGASFFMLLALWILGLTVVLLTQDVLLNAFPSIQRIWLWMSFIGVYLVISTFVALPLLFYIAFVRQGRMQTMTDMKAELEHYGWDEELMGDVVQRYNQTSRPPAFIVPLYLATAISLLGWILVFFSNGFDVVLSMARDQGISSGLIAIARSHPVSIGFLGAYFFSIQYLLRRYLSHDIGPGVFMHLFVRSLVVLILAFVYTLVRVNNPSAFEGVQWPADILAVCFVGGVMPNILWNWLRDFVRRLPGLGEGDVENEIPLTKVQGLNMWQRARLIESGVENSQNLAMTDIVEIMVTTRLGVVRLLDWIDQAMLIIHLSDDDEIDAYRRMGIRSASAFVLNFFGPQNDEPSEWNELVPGTRIFLDDNGEVPNKVIGRIISITTHPNFHRVQQLRRWAQKAAENKNEMMSAEMARAGLAEGNGHQQVNQGECVGDAFSE